MLAFVGVLPPGGRAERGHPDGGEARSSTTSPAPVGSSVGSAASRPPARWSAPSSPGSCSWPRRRPARSSTSSAAVLVVLGVALTLWLSRRDTAVTVVIVAAGRRWLHARRRRDRAVPGRERLLLHARRARPVPRPAAASSGSTTCATATSTSPIRPLLEFDYARSFADTVDAAFPDGPAARRAPRRRRRVHPPALPRGDPAGHAGARCSRSIPRCCDLARDELGLRTSPALQSEDRRRAARASATRPTTRATSSWATRSAACRCPGTSPPASSWRRSTACCGPDGVYVQNVIDYPTFRFARAQLATLREQFEYVAAIAPQSSFDGDFGGNVVLVASHRAARSQRPARALAAKHGDVVLDGAALDRFIGSAPGDHRRLRAGRPVAARGLGLVDRSADGCSSANTRVGVGTEHRARDAGCRCARRRTSPAWGTAGSALPTGGRPPRATRPRRSADRRTGRRPGCTAPTGSPPR